MKNPVTGKYEVYKFFPSTGATVTGIGDTQDEARVDYKTKLKAYREQPLVPTGEYVRSPGYTTVEGPDGKVSYVYREDRQKQILARPEVAEALKKASGENV